MESQETLKLKVRRIRSWKLARFVIFSNSLKVPLKWSHMTRTTKFWTSLKKGQNLPLTRQDLKSFTVLVCALLLTATSLISCGLSDDPPQDSGIYDLGNLQGGCELNTEQLEKILEENIVADLNCLETTLDQFVQFVKREDPRFINRQELGQFVDKFFPEEKELIRNILKLVYNLNTLLNRDPVDKINTENLKKIFEIARVVNREGAPLFSLLEGLTKENYWQRRQDIFQAVEKGARGILGVIVTKDPASNPQLSITDFLTDIKTILELDDTELDIERVSSFLFIKKLLTGGEAETLTANEVIQIFDRASDLVLLGMDAIFYSGKTFNTKGEEYYFYYDIVKELKENLHPFQDTEMILSQKDILEIVDEFLGKDINVSNISRGLSNFKEKFFGGAPDQYLYRDVTTLINWGLEFSGMLYFNEITYEYYRPQMDSKKAIASISFPKIENYHVFPDWMIKKHWDNFRYVTTNYRYFQDDDGKSHFFDYYKRFKSGFQLTSMLRWAVTKVVSVYGHYPEGKRYKEADREDFKKLMNDYRGIIEELDFWPDDLDDFISDALISSDLFMYHSDGNDAGGSEEFTEFAINALHAYSISDKVHTELKKHCPIIDPDTESYEISCFREYFLHVFFNELGYQRYYHNLYQYLQKSGVDVVRRYAINIELYSRLEEDPSSPITKSQMGRFVVILSNLETAYLRFDIDKNGILDRGELDVAYLVFKGLVVSVADLGEGKEKLYKSIFLYLVKNMKVPNPVQLTWFHLFARKKDITATRFNISAILSSFEI